MVKMVIPSTEHKMYETVSVVAAALITITTTWCCYRSKKNGFEMQEN
jgi:hypothetical protein